MNATVKYLALLSYIEGIMRTLTFARTFEAGDIANNIYLKFGKRGLRYQKKQVLPFINQERSDEQLSHLHADDFYNLKESKKQATAKRKREDESYSTIIKDRVNSWEKVQRLVQTTWAKKRNEKAREKLHRYLVKQESSKPQVCPLSKGQCMRMPFKKRNNHACCPLKEMFSLEKGKCIPVKKNKNSSENE